MKAVEVISKNSKTIPHKVRMLQNPPGSEDEGILFSRFDRDGFKRAGPWPESDKALRLLTEDPGWVLQPSRKHPTLRVRYRGYAPPRVFEWDLPDHPDILDSKVSWAAYDFLGQLLVARLGIVYRYSLRDLLAGQPSAVFDLEPLE